MRLFETTGNGAEKFSIDDPLLEYLSKKATIEQTEKLFIAKISSKMETSIQQVETSINRLSEQHLIRKISWPGKVTFELTPKGKQSIDALAKAQTDRITRQLQEAIHQGRKTKLRFSTINKMNSIGNEWQSYKIPDKSLMDGIEQEANKFLLLTKEIENKQPKCNETPQNYDKQFEQYKNQIENLIQQSNNINKKVNDYIKIRNHKLSISIDIEKINKTINKYEIEPEATSQVSQLKNTLSNLISIQSQVESFEQDKLSRFEDLKNKLEENSRILEILKKPTHEFMPTKRENSPENPIQYPDPEVPTIYESKTTGYTLDEKCGKCGTKRKSKPVNIG